MVPKPFIEDAVGVDGQGANGCDGHALELAAVERDPRCTADTQGNISVQSGVSFKLQYLEAGQWANLTARVERYTLCMSLLVLSTTFKRTVLSPKAPIIVKEGLTRRRQQ